MKSLSSLILILFLAVIPLQAAAQTRRSAAASSPSTSYAGFDKNEYPGDNLLPGLRRSFAYASYWLNNPPGATNNPWKGKRALLQSDGFGFLILFNGRLDAQLRSKDAAALGRADAAAATAAAKVEGFPARAILFLDQEEGGRLLSEQLAYLLAWVDGVRSSGYRPGVYCSGIRVPDGPGTIDTADDIVSHKGNRDIALWIANDQCPPSPGCRLPTGPLSPAASGTPQAMVWQYAQSPRRPFANQCRTTYAVDGNCYAPDLPPSPQTFLDMNVSVSADPSSGRSADLGIKSSK